MLAPLRSASSLSSQAKAKAEEAERDDGPAPLSKRRSFDAIVTNPLLQGKLSASLNSVFATYGTDLMPGLSAMA